MLPVSESFKYEYRGCDLIYGRGCVGRLDNYLAECDLDRALIVCGSNVGANDELMEPITEGLGDRLAGVFDGTTPEKSAEDAFGAIGEMHETNADVLVGVGGGSSLDVARQASVFAPDGRSLAELREEARDGEVIPPDPNDERPPVIVVPTTFAGADVSDSGSIELLSAAESPTGQPASVGGSAMPIADFADPDLFGTTPAGALLGSAMNGLDKGIETPYARDANPVSDAAAVHGLRLLSGALPRAVGGSDDVEAMERAVVGSLLVQIDRKISIIHAFGHGFARRYSLQQGAVHAVVARTCSGTSSRRSTRAAPCWWRGSEPTLPGAPPTNSPTRSSRPSPRCATRSTRRRASGTSPRLDERTSPRSPSSSSTIRRWPARRQGWSRPSRRSRRCFATPGDHDTPRDAPFVDRNAVRTDR